jgi:hypothetical protein
MNSEAESPSFSFMQNLSTYALMNISLYIITLLKSTKKKSKNQGKVQGTLYSFFSYYGLACMQCSTDPIGSGTGSDHFDKTICSVFILKTEILSLLV